MTQDSGLSTPDLSTSDIIAVLHFADSMPPGIERSNDGGTVVASQQRSSPDLVSVTPPSTPPSDRLPELEDTPPGLTLSNSMVEAIKVVAAETEFLEELGLSPDDYMQLLEGVDLVQLDARAEGQE